MVAEVAAVIHAAVDAQCHDIENRRITKEIVELCAITFNCPMFELVDVVIPSQASPLSDTAKIVEMKLWSKQMQRFDVTGMRLMFEIRFADTKRGHCAFAGITLIDGSQSPIDGSQSPIDGSHL